MKTKRKTVRVGGYTFAFYSLRSMCGLVGDSEWPMSAREKALLRALMWTRARLARVTEDWVERSKPR